MYPVVLAFSTTEDTEDHRGMDKDKIRANRVRGGEKGMRKPAIRVTKWLRDIPVEATCALCPGSSFRASSSSHRPNREEYQKSLQAQFDEHVRRVHPPIAPEPANETVGR